MSWLGRLLAWARRARRGRVVGPACPRALEEAGAGWLHVSPSGRLVTLRLSPPSIVDTCPWCQADLVGRLESGHWALTDAGRLHAALVREGERARRPA